MDKNVRELAEKKLTETSLFLLHFGLACDDKCTSLKCDGGEFDISELKCRMCLAKAILDAGYIKPAPSENSHLETEGELELTDEEIDNAINDWQEKQDDVWGKHRKGELETIRAYEMSAELGTEQRAVAKAQLSKLSPHLARLEGENERLTNVCADQAQEVLTLRMQKEDEDTRLSQAVQAERDRIVSVLVRYYKCPVDASKEDCKTKVSCNECWEQALQK